MTTCDAGIPTIPESRTPEQVIADHVAGYLAEIQPIRCILRDAPSLERMGIYYDVVIQVRDTLDRQGPHLHRLPEGIQP